MAGMVVKSTDKDAAGSSYIDDSYYDKHGNVMAITGEQIEKTMVLFEKYIKEPVAESEDKQTLNGPKSGKSLSRGNFWSIDFCPKEILAAKGSEVLDSVGSFGTPIICLFGE